MPSMGLSLSLMTHCSAYPDLNLPTASLADRCPDLDYEDEQPDPYAPHGEIPYVATTQNGPKDFAAVPPY